MQIDNYQEAQALSDRLEATVPFQVRAAKELLKTLRDRGESVSVDTQFTVDWVKYSGDIGGINCGLKPSPEQTEKQRYVVSLTHLEIDPQHPLASEVKSYQRRRIQRLKLQEQGGFAAELLTQRTQTRKKGKKGFGK